MIRFVYGDAGSGKTEYIFSLLRADAEAGVRSFLIVPEQQTVAAERDILTRLPARSQLTLEVLNFSRLANRVFRERGGLVYNYATPALRRLMMWRALSSLAPLLGEYGRRATDDRTLPEAVLTTVRELKAAGISPEMLENAAAQLPDGPLAGKLRDLSLTAAGYEALLGERFTDADDDLSRLCDTLDRAPFFTGAHVYIDSFTSLTGIEHAVVRRIFAQAHETTVCIGIPSPVSRSIDTVSLRAFSDRMRRDASSIGCRVVTTELNENHRAQNAELRRLARDLWRLDAPAYDGENETDATLSVEESHIELRRANDLYDEAEDVAARIRELMECGVRCRDIVIVARNADKYRGILEPSLEAMGIPYFFSEKTELSQSPLSRLILSALRIPVYGWRRDDVISHLKTGLCGIAPRDADIFEAYTAKWRIGGKRFYDSDAWNMNPDGYTDRLSERGIEILATAEAVRQTLVPRLMRYFAGLAAASDVSGLCRETVAYLDALGVRDAMRSVAVRELSIGHPREAEEAARSYDAVLDALECVSDAFNGAPKPDTRTFASAIRTALEASEIGTIPTSSDEVTVGSADMLRARSPRCVIILGAADGEFPGNAPAGGLLSDSDREVLASLDVALPGDREERASDELYFFRRAVAAASERVIIYTHASGSGGACRPSVAYTRIQTMFPYLTVTDTGSDLLRRLRTPRAAAEYVSLLSGTESGEALRAALEEYGHAPLLYSDGAYPPVEAAADRISPSVAAEVFGPRIRLSQSQVELYLNCRFSYCCRYMLRLDEGTRVEFAYDSIGTFVHHVLEKYFYRVYILSGGLLPDAAGRAALLDEIIGEYVENFFPPSSDSGSQPARLSYTLTRLRRLSELLIGDIERELADADFRPEYFELPIGRNSAPALSFTLNDGTEITVAGVVDRVDVFRRDGKAYIRVVDYKTGDKVFSPSDVKDGINLQLLIYLFSLTRGASSGLFGDDTPLPAGIEYLSSHRKQLTVNDPSDTEGTLHRAAEGFVRSGLLLDDDDIIHATSHTENPRYLMQSSKNNSLITPEGFDLLFGELGYLLRGVASQMRSGGAEARLRRVGSYRCSYCAYRAVCRSAQPDKYQR